MIEKVCIWYVHRWHKTNRGFCIRNALPSCHHIIIATATAPPSIKTISFPILAAAAPDCKPGEPVDVVAGLAPAVPLGVGAAEYGAGTTVMAVMVLWLPSGKVVVCRIVEVMEREDAAEDDGAPVVAAPAFPADSVRVTKPPPTVLTIVAPVPSVVVTTDPGAAGEGERVTMPPPTVLTIVTPDPSVVVTTDPGAAGEGERVTMPPPTVLTIVTPDPSVVVTADPGAVATTVAVETPPGADPAAVDAAAPDWP